MRIVSSIYTQLCFGQLWRSFWLIKIMVNIIANIRLRLCYADMFSGVDGKPVESCTGVLGPALVTRAVAAAAGERFGGPALGWWFVLADLVILPRLHRSEVPELEPRICTGRSLVDVPQRLRLTVHDGAHLRLRKPSMAMVCRSEERRVGKECSW